MKNILPILFCLSIFLPFQRIGGYLLSLDDFLVCIAVMYVATSFRSFDFLGGRMLLHRKVFLFYVAFVVVFSFVGFFQVLVASGEVKAPTELWQFLKRAVIFYLVASIVQQSSPRQTKYLIFSIIAITYLCLIVGVLQYLGWDGLSEIYARTEKQYIASARNVSKRLIGISGFSNAWGAFSVSAAISISLLFLILHKLYRIRYLQFPLMLLYVLSAFNLVFSGSRSALMSSAIVLFLFLIWASFTVRFAKFKFVLYSIIAMASVSALANVFFSEQLEFLQYRFDVLGQQQGGIRLEQISTATALTDSVPSIFFGVSNAVQRSLGVSHGVEVEAVNIYVSYGLIGLAALYFPIYLIITQPYRNVLKSRGRIDDGMMNFVHALLWIFNLIFSLGYFFLQELVSGTLVWIVSGIYIGVISKYARSNRGLGRRVRGHASV